MQEHIRDFLAQLESRKDIKTIQGYMYDLQDFKKYIEKKEINYLELEANKAQEVINSYLNRLKRDLKPSTINRRCISINKFNAHIALGGVRAVSIKIQKQIFLENVISEKQVKKLLSKCKNKRDEAIIRLLIGTGMRVSELLSLTIYDVNKKHVMVEGKYKKNRTIMIPQDARAAMKEYMQVRGPTKEKKLFLGRKKPMVRQTVNNILERLGKAAKVPLDVCHPHSFRHAFCKKLSEQGVSIDTIAALAGHESLETTAIYTKKTWGELYGVVNNIWNI